MRVEDAMTTPVVTVDRDTTAREAIEAMLRHRVGSVVVEFEGNVVGILTRSDALRAAYHAGDRLRDIPVTKAMTGDPLTTKPARTLRSTLRTMERHDIKKLPVTEGFETIGMITMTDIAEQLPEEVRESLNNLTRQDEWEQ